MDDPFIAAGDPQILMSPRRPPYRSARIRYGSELLPAMPTMFCQLGGFDSIVEGKTVAVKINMTGAPTYRLGYHPVENTHCTHPRVIGAAVHLLGRASARCPGPKDPGCVESWTRSPPAR